MAIPSYYADPFNDGSCVFYVPFLDDDDTDWHGAVKTTPHFTVNQSFTFDSTNPFYSKIGAEKVGLVNWSYSYAYDTTGSIGHLDPNINGITFTAWFKRTGSGGYFEIIVDSFTLNRSGSDNPDARCSYNAYLQLWWDKVSNKLYCGNSPSVRSLSISTGIWHHLAVRYCTDGTWDIFIDGSIVNSGVSPTWTHCSDPNAYQYLRCANVVHCDWRIFNRCLTDEEVNKLYTLEAFVEPRPPYDPNFVSDDNIKPLVVPNNEIRNFLLLRFRKARKPNLDRLYASWLRDLKPLTLQNGIWTWEEVQALEKLSYWLYEKLFFNAVQLKIENFPDMDLVPDGYLIKRPNKEDVIKTIKANLYDLNEYIKIT